MEGNRLPSAWRKVGLFPACGVRTMATAVKIRLGPGWELWEIEGREMEPNGRASGWNPIGGHLGDSSLRAHNSVPTEHRGVSWGPRHRSLGGASGVRPVLRNEGQAVCPLPAWIHFLHVLKLLGTCSWVHGLS